MPPALLFLVTYFTPTLAIPAIDLWKLPANNPAPPPELGPPGAVNADRNPSHLKYEVAAIIGAYLLWLLGTALLYFLVGRRLRQRNTAEVTNGSLKMFKLQGKPGPKDLRLSPEDLRKSPNTSVTSPKGSGKLPSIRSWGRKEQKPHDSAISVSSVGSAPKDEAHQAKNMAELGDLYAQVMAHAEQKEAVSRVTSIRPEPQATTASPEPQGATIIQQSPSVSNDYDDDDGYSNFSSPHVEEESLYQSNKLSHPLAPTPVDDNFGRDSYDSRYSRSGRNRSRRSKPLSILSELGSRASSIISPRTPRRTSNKGLNISQPLGSAGFSNSDIYADNVPLSPRLYRPGPPPLTPSQLRHQQQEPTVPEDEEPRSESPAKERRAPPSLNLRDSAGSSIHNATNPNKALPFREVYGDSSLRSAPPTRTTFIERPGKTDGGLKTGSIVPQTPYSPYMPYTPMTPITPNRLVGKAEMKRNKKEARMKVLTEDDLVEPEDPGY
jgi:hypothetical protein